MFYLFLAYSFIWGLIAVYIVILGRRQKKLKEDIRLLEEWHSD